MMNTPPGHTEPPSTEPQLDIYAPGVSDMIDPSTAPAPEPVVYDRRIRFSDCDTQRIVYNPNYLVYWDDAFTDYMDAVGCS